MAQSANAAISVTTIVEPTGVPHRIERIIPKSAQNTERHAEKMVTERKLLNILMAESAGKITRADTRSEPTRFIARTMITAMTVAMRRFKRFVFVPTAFAKFSSNVTAKNLL